jgi:hypothetical protein
MSEENLQVLRRDKLTVIELFLYIKNHDKTGDVYVLL